MDVYPEVIDRLISFDTGTFSIEFGGKNYICQRISKVYLKLYLLLVEVNSLVDTKELIYKRFILFKKTVFIKNVNSFLN